MTVICDATDSMGEHRSHPVERDRTPVADLMDVADPRC
jgi:hypothetical protein